MPKDQTFKTRECSDNEQARRLLDLGYRGLVPIADGSKKPIHLGWPDNPVTRENVDQMFPEGEQRNIGIRNADLPNIDCDIWDETVAPKLEALVAKHFPGAMLRIGRSPKFAALFRPPSEHFKVPKLIVYKDGDKENGAKAEIDIRTGSRAQSVVLGIHPDTGQEYSYPDEHLLDVPVEQHPVLTKEAVEAFLKDAEEILVAHGYFHPTAPERTVVPAYVEVGDYARDATLNALREGPNNLDDYEDWITLMVTLITLFGQDDADMREAWDDWSKRWKRAQKYDPCEKWDAPFEPRGELGLGSLYRLLEKSGIDTGPIKMVGVQDDGHDPRASRQPQVDPVGMFETSMQFIQRRTKSDYMDSRISLQKGQLVTITGQAGDGKTAVGMAIAVEMARGKLLDGTCIKPRRTLYFSGENSEDNRLRFELYCALNHVPPDDIDITWVPHRFRMDQQTAEDMQTEAAKYGEFDLIIVDTHVAYFSGTDENSNSEMQAYYDTLRTWTRILGGPAVAVLTHPAKNNKDRTPRGGGAIIGTIDGNYTVENKGDRFTVLHHSSKFRGTPFEPLYLRFIPMEHPSATGLSGEPEKSVWVMYAQSETAENHTISKILQYLHENPGDSKRTVAKATNLPSGSMGRWMQRLAEKGYLKADGNGKYQITPSGKEEIGIIDLPDW